MTSKSVVLPAPLGPMIPTISPWSACRDTSCRALLPPKLSESPRTSISARLPRSPPPVRRRRRPERLGGLLRGRRTTAARDGPPARRRSRRSARRRSPSRRRGRPPPPRRSSTARPGGWRYRPWRIDSMAPSSCSTTMGERPSESSSMRNSLGRVMVAMARASICCWPPERLAARSLAPRGQGGEGGERLVDHVGVVLAAPPALPGRDAQVVLHAQVGEDPLAAGHLGHAEAGDLVGRQVGDVAPVEDDGAVVGLDHPADGPQQRRLAGAVGADEGDDLALADLDRDVGQDDDAVVADAELAHGEERQPAGRGGPTSIWVRVRMEVHTSCTSRSMRPPALATMSPPMTKIGTRISRP